MFQYEARIIRIKDGDTLVLDVDLGFHIRHEIDVRLAHIDTPEVMNFGIGGVQDPARQFIEQTCPIGSVCIVNISRAEKFGRWLAEIIYSQGARDRNEVMKDPRVLNDELIKAGLARPYEGGRK